MALDISDPRFDDYAPVDSPDPCPVCGECAGWFAQDDGWVCAGCGAWTPLDNPDEPEPEPCEICGAIGLDFTLYVDASGVGHNVCAACDEEPTRTNDAEDRYNRGGW